MTKKKTDSAAEMKFHLDNTLENGIDFENRIIRVTGVIGSPNPMMGGDFFDFNLMDVALTKMESLDPTAEIKIHINTPGGECYDALAMIGRMKSSPCPITTIAYGHCMSAGTLILMAGDTRKISKYCVAMYHEIGYGVSGQHENVKEQVLQSERELKRWAKYYEDFSNKSSKFWLSKMKKAEFYPTPEQMLEYGAVDEII